MHQPPHCLVLALAFCTLTSLGVCAGGDRLYTVNSNDPNIRMVDPLTMTTKATVPMTASGYTIKWANGLALNPITGKLFVLLTVSGGSARLLGTVDPASGAVTPIGSTGQMFAGLAFDWIGNLYGVTGDGATTPSTLYSLSTTTGTPTFLKTFTNPDYGETITFDPLTGQVLHASGDTNQVFESLNLTTLALTNIPLTGDKIGEMLSMVHIAGRNFLSVDLNDDVFILNASGLSSLVGHMDHSYVKGIAFSKPPQTGGYFNLYGDGQPATGGHIPALLASGNPTWTGSVSLGVLNGYGGAPAALTFGSGQTAVTFTSTCVLQNFPISTVVLPMTLAGPTPGKGSATLTLPVPAGAGPADIFFQVVVLESAAQKLVSTNPIQVRVN